MNGRPVVIGLLSLAALTAGLFWKVGLDIRADLSTRAEAAHLPKLSREEAAVRAAKEDMYGLPSRLENAPSRDIARVSYEGTVANPFPADPSGVAALFSVYAVSVKGCKGQLLSPEREADQLLVYVTLEPADGLGRVVAIDGFGEAIRTRPYTNCLVGAVRGAVFAAPTQPQLTITHALRLKQ